MLDRFQGLPVHPLLVHATVVVLPLAALLVVLAAVWPRFRSWAGPLPAVTAILSVVLVPLSTASGEAFYERIEDATGGENPLIEHHQELAETLLWIALPFAVLAVLGYWLHRTGGPKPLLIAVSVMSVLAAGALAVDVALIGHAGAKAVYEGSP